MYTCKKAVVLLALFAYAISLAGCDNTTDTGGGTTESVSDAATIIAEETRYIPDLPEKDFEGYEFKFYQRGPDASEWSERCIYAESENGEPINDAVYQRNRYIENKYNIKIVPVNGRGEIYDGDVKKQFEASVQAQDQTFDAAMMGVYDSSLLSTAGMLVDLKTVPHIDLSKPWWDNSVNATLEILNKQYFALARMGINDKDDSFCILFNKQVQRELDLPDFYQMVRDNKWTMDEFTWMAREAVKDLNGDAKFDAEDRYGYTGFDAEAWNWFIASGVSIAQIDGEGKPFLTMMNDRSVNLIEKIRDLMLRDNIMINVSRPMMTGNLHDNVYNELAQNKVLFAGAAFTVVQRARAMEQDFGMLPYPKLDAAQDKHYNIVGLWGPTAVTVPTMNTELERTGIILEAMVAEGMNTIYPAYYDINLVTKGLRDEDSKEMLDIIMDGRIYDVGMLYNWGGLRDIIIEASFGGSNNFVSLYEARENAALTAMNKTMEQFAEIIE